MPSSTKDRILDTARRLFNERGYGNVTIAVLASELGIAKGNLWYHFKEQRALLEALTVSFLELDTMRRQMEPDPENILDSFLEILLALSHEIREYRFLFRDQASYGEHTDTMLKALPELYSQTQAQLIGYFEVMRQQNMLEARDETLAPLTYNVMLLLRYNLDFHREWGHPDQGAVQHTMEQLLAMLDEKLSKDASDYLVYAFRSRHLERVSG